MMPAKAATGASGQLGVLCNELNATRERARVRAA